MDQYGGQTSQPVQPVQPGQTYQPGQVQPGQPGQMNQPVGVQPTQPGQVSQLVQSSPWELSEDQLNRLGWTSFYNACKQIIDYEYATAFKWRTSLPYLEAGNDPDNIFDHRFESESDIITIPSQHRLVSAEVRSDFKVLTAQTGDPGVAQALTTRAARRVALGAELVCLFGRDAETELDKQGIKHDNIDEQESRLTEPGQGPVDASILDSVLRAIEELQTRGHFGDYCAVVAPDLYRQAFQPIQSTQDAPIHQIRPLLAESGFNLSRALDTGVGVVFSRGGGTIYLTCPRPPHIVWVQEERDFVLGILERFRLLVNDPSAVEPLR
jgi:hypothetical protein